MHNNNLLKLKKTYKVETDTISSFHFHSIDGATQKAHLTLAKLNNFHFK